MTAVTAATDFCQGTARSTKALCRVDICSWRKPGNRRAAVLDISQLVFSALEWPCFEGRHSCAVWSTAASGFSIASGAIVSPYAVPTWHLTSLKINKSWSDIIVLELLANQLIHMELAISTHSSRDLRSTSSLPGHCSANGLSESKTTRHLSMLSCQEVSKLATWASRSFKG